MNTPEILYAGAQWIEAAALIVVVAAIVVGLRYFRDTKRQSYIKRVVQAVEQEYGQLDGPERRQKAEALILERYPRINREQLGVALEAAVLILNLSVQAIEQAQIDPVPSLDLDE